MENEESIIFYEQPIDDDIDDSIPSIATDVNYNTFDDTIGPLRESHYEDEDEMQNDLSYTTIQDTHQGYDQRAHRTRTTLDQCVPYQRRHHRQLQPVEHHRRYSQPRL